MVALLPLLATGGALVGGIRGFRRSGGNLGSALLGAGTGALTASGAGGLGRFAGGKLLGAVLPGGLTGIGGKALLQAAAGGNLSAQALLKLPAIAGAGAGGASILSGNLGVPQGTGGRVAGRPAIAGPAGLIGYNTVTGEPMTAGGTPLPPGMDQFGGISPFGDPLQVINPAGLDAGRRLRTVKDAEALRDATNIVLPTVRKFAEQAKRDEFARGMASAGIKQNILTNAQLTENMQKAALNLGTTAANQAGAALTARYNY